ncbi:MAG: NADH-quinone oxidoreductase subunit J [Actinomycetota bacterium]|nr:NADH-quinone oxidoreductase subunit J [Acidimicrobiia bacterium]MDQ3147218.1 NADH-quinone oxidoreductase subunit J [Actinomycetota bacterium]
MEGVVFLVAAGIVLAGAVGVIASSNPVHSALMLVMTLFGIAVLFVAQGAHFLAAVQVIVYAGAIVVLFLFVIMLLGVDKAENLRVDPLGGQRPAAAVVAVAGIGLVILLAVRSAQVTGAEGVTRPIEADEPNLETLGRALFTDYLFAFEATSALLVIAVVGAVVFARRVKVED